MCIGQTIRAWWPYAAGGGGRPQSFCAILCFVFDRQYSKYFTQNVHQIVQFECQKCKNSLVWEGGHPPPTPSPRSGASRPRLRCPTIKANNLAHPEKKSSIRPWFGPPLFENPGSAPDVCVCVCMYVSESTCIHLLCLVYTRIKKN